MSINNTSLYLCLVAAIVGCASQDEAFEGEGEVATSQQGSQVPATAATVSGTCARLDEVGMEFPTVATFKEAGGWSTSNTSGNARKAWNATELESCNTYISGSTGTIHKNNVTCFYETDNGPQLKASKTFPSEYACTCNSSSGRYTCIRQ